MKLTCEREKFLHAFQTAAGVTPSKTTKPILNNIKLEATKEGATLLGTDLEVGVRIEVPGLTVEAPGTVLLPAARFGSILRESSDDKLVVESDDRKTMVHGERSEFQLPSENPAEYPPVASFGETRYYELPARFLREAIRRTAFATDPESSRYALGGVAFELSTETMVAVATDGRRLARQEGPLKAVGVEQALDRATIIPTRALTLLERAIGESDENVQLAARDNDVLIKCGRATFYSRLVEGRFPKWRDVFPRAEADVRLELPTGPFLAAVRQAAIVTSEDRRGVEFAFADGKVTLTAHGAEYGESRVEQLIAYDGPAVAVNLDPRYVIDFLKVLPLEGNFALELRGPETAVVCSADEGRYAYVIMPLARDQA